MAEYTVFPYATIAHFTRVLEPKIRIQRVVTRLAKYRSNQDYIDSSQPENRGCIGVADCTAEQTKPKTFQAGPLMLYLRDLVLTLRIGRPPSA
jgi:hypothetical protein